MAPDELGHNGWDEWKNHVLLELKDNRDDHKAIMTKIDDLALNRLAQLNSSISALQVRSGVWGILGGFIPVFILIMIWYFEKGK